MSEDKKNKTVYRLYATRTTEDIVSKVADMRFVRINADYTLVYASDGIIMRSVLRNIKYTIIGDEEVNRLSAADKYWLTNCNFTIIAEETVKNDAIVLQNMSDMLDVLETELKKNRSETTDSEDKENE